MGAGALGTALAKVLADAGGEVTLWARRAGGAADQINTTRYNLDYLPGALLPPSIHATADAEEALGGRIHCAGRECPRRPCGPISSGGLLFAKVRPWSV